MWRRRGCEQSRTQQIVKKVLDNGLTVIVKPEKGSGLVAIVAIVKVGAGQESIQTAGVGNFVSRLLLAEHASEVSRAGRVHRR